MATFNLQCKSLSQIHSSVYFRLKVVCRAYIGYILQALVNKNVNMVKQLYNS